jgi:hypothetical protein
VRAPCRDRQCPDAPLENFISGPGTKSVPAGFLLLQTQFGLMICARQSLGLTIDNSPEAPLRDMLRQPKMAGLYLARVLAN